MHSQSLDGNKQSVEHLGMKKKIKRNEKIVKTKKCHYLVVGLISSKGIFSEAINAETKSDSLMMQ